MLVSHSIAMTVPLSMKILMKFKVTLKLLPLRKTAIRGRLDDTQIGHNHSQTVSESMRYISE